MLKKIIIQIFFLNFVLITYAQSGESGGMPQLNPEFWISQIVWLVLTFGFLYIVLSKLILPKISDNLESRKSQILENIETAELQRKESEKKIKEFEKIILESKLKAKNHFNEVRQKTLEDISNKRIVLEKDIDKEISAAEEEINNLKINSSEKIKNIAIETSNELIKQLIGEQVNNSSISAIVEEQSKKDKENQYGI
jgi:F-type H+-transporting ATPase subunit b|tara:strand:- start:149 stop:739 length:591 start_codon:yes stop_codon:yes gene_type:complete